MEKLLLPFPFKAPSGTDAIFDLCHMGIASDLLAAAGTHLRVFSLLAGAPLSFESLREELSLSDRAAMVFLTALRALGMLIVDDRDHFALSDVARLYFGPESPCDLTSYFGLVAGHRNAMELSERLTTGDPTGTFSGEQTPLFVYRKDVDAATEDATIARRTTLALADHAKVVAPVFAEKAALTGNECLLDIGGGAGLYSIACLQRYPRLRAVVLDRPEVVKVASELACAHEVADRLECVPGDMLQDSLDRGCDVILLSNVLHDWDVPDCQQLVERCSRTLAPGGRLLIHEYFLNDAFDGPLAIALHSVFLFCVTYGRAYSTNEYRAMCVGAGLEVGWTAPTLMHLGILSASKRSV